MPFISLQHIKKRYTVGTVTVRALDDVSLQVQRGECLAIVGQSGSGKSTMMSIVGCLDVPTEGTYLFEGRDVSRLSGAELSVIRSRQIGFVFQKFHLLPTLTALENVELPLQYRGLPAGKCRAIAKEALERVGLSDRMQHRPFALSGGQQQRVAIARAIASHPPLILADEPTGNLDCASGETVMRLLCELHQDGHTVVLITHDEAVAAVADRRVRMADGKLYDA